MKFFDGKVHMPFRRAKQEARQWNGWIATHRDELAATGVPHRIFGHERRWFYFLEHGCYPGEGTFPLFDLDHLSSTEALRLLTFLRNHAQIENSVAQRDLERIC